MKSFPKVLALSVSGLLATSVLAGCGGDDEPSATSRADAAKTQACRTFAMTGGASGDALVGELVTAAGTGSYEPEPLIAELQLIRTAATAAGLVADLSDEDFRLYRDVASAVGGLAGPTNLRSVDEALVGAVRDSITAVERRCG